MFSEKPTPESLIKEILSETKKYNEAIHGDKPFFEAKEIRRNVKRLADELRKMFQAERENNQ
jgi:hypothetical protein